jgi:ABC-2 type transport system permease protein
MRRVPTLMNRELKTYFQSPLAYVLTAVFLFVISVFIYGRTNSFNYGTPKDVMAVILWWGVLLMVIIAPILTMRLLAGEKDSGTIEVLVTDPVTDWDIVLGKFSAALLTLLAMVVPLGAYLVLFWAFNKTGPASCPPPDWGPVLTGTAGLVSVAALSAATGLFASSLTRSQVISALVGFVLLLGFWLIGLLLPIVVTTGKWTELAESLSLPNRFQPLVEGQLATQSLFYYLSTTALLLYLTVRSVESRKWR